MNKRKSESAVGTLARYKLALDSLEIARTALEASGADDELIDAFEEAVHAEALTGMSCDLFDKRKLAQAERTRWEMKRAGYTAAEIRETLRTIKAKAA
jgi:hypothetical protein